MSTWDPGGPGILTLPSGRLVRGRALRRPPPPGPPPTLRVYLLGTPPPEVEAPEVEAPEVEAPEVEWEHRWVRWPDFWVPRDPSGARQVLREAWVRAATDRVEIACGGGRGRTGTALACLAVLDGVPAARAVEFVRRHYHPRAVETPWQRWYVRRFPRA